ncbi:BTB/POZ domain-containing protein KCTD9 [Ixodes scapularis]
MSGRPNFDSNLRVLIYRNGATRDGKIFPVPESLEKLLQAVSAKFGMQAKRLFTDKGGEIDDVALIRDEDVLYASCGEGFLGMLADAAPAPPLAPGNPDWVLLNVGGKHFATTRSTLVSKEPRSMLGRLFGNGTSPAWGSARDSRGAYLVDRSPRHFEPLLNYLRHGQLVLDGGLSPQGVLEEAKFFGIESLVPVLEQIIQGERGPRDYSPLTRRDVVDALTTTSHLSELRFQGVNLSGADLSRLDLRHINFKWANLQGARLSGANLSYCCLERADLSLANLEGAQLVGAKMLCANMEGAILRSCNMEDPAGNSANLEGVNLKNANLEGSQMAGVNLRVATLKNANLQNCHLRQAILAGADLENCDLSGSDLHEANLRGANLKDATMELMLTPLHMAQAIR